MFLVLRLPAFYAKPRTLAEMIDHTLGRALDLFEIDTGTVFRWDPKRRKERRSRE